jgi:transposase
MSSSITIAGIEIPQTDWDATPASVKLLVTVLSERLAYIEEQLQQNSQNSSRPPSSDGLSNKPKQSSSKKQSAKPRQKKARHANESSQTPKLYELESCAQVHEYVPYACGHCGEPLTGKDNTPHRHQIIDIPPLEAYVIEHRLHQLMCECCGQKTRASLPTEVPTTRYGDRLAAILGWLSGEHRQSHRMVQSLLSTMFGIEVSRGSINRLRQQVSEAVATPVEAAHTYVQSQAVLHSDETGFNQGNGDGLNPKQT